MEKFKKDKIKKVRKSGLLSGTIAIATAAAMNALYEEVFANSMAAEKPVAAIGSHKRDDGLFIKDALLILMILKYSKLPAEVTMKAWSDQRYRNFLLRNPNSVLHEYWAESVGLDFIVHPNTSKIKNFCLPFPTESIRSLTPIEILSQLEYEMGRTASLHYFLPSSVVAKSLFDDDFKKALLKDPNKTLQSMGYPVSDHTCIVHENTDHTRHLILDVSPNDLQGLSEIERRVVTQSRCNVCHGGPGETFTCCATGTCD
ncbi:MAG: hypothetical protein ACE5GK_10130 [Nitrospiria bacterium]